MKPRQSEALFRFFFSLIFLALGLEHLFSDQLIQAMMPTWMPMKRFFSMGSGCVLLLGGTSILLGYKVRWGALLLGLFLIGVTATIHGPALFHVPADLDPQWHWLWQVYQRSNFVKNLCLLGGCFHFYNHSVGPYSLESWLYRRKKHPHP